MAKSKHGPHAISKMDPPPLSQHFRDRLKDLRLSRGLVTREEAADQGFPDPEVSPLVLIGLGLFAVAAGLVWLGYQFGKKADQLNDTLQKATQALQDIADSARRIADDADKIVALLESLPDKLKGIEVNIRLTDAMATASSASATIRTYTNDPQLFAQNKDLVMTRLEQLQDSIYDFLYLGGANGLTYAAPFVATWTQTFANVQRMLKEQNLQWVNPYKTGLHSDIVSYLWKAAQNYADIVLEPYADHPVPSRMFRIVYKINDPGIPAPAYFWPVSGPFGEGMSGNRISFKDEYNEGEITVDGPYYSLQREENVYSLIRLKFNEDSKKLRWVLAQRPPMSNEDGDAFRLWDKISGEYQGALQNLFLYSEGFDGAWEILEENVLTTPPDWH